MWTRDDMVRQAIKAQEDAKRDDQCFSSIILFDIAVDTIARMVIDNAASVAERYGDPEIEDEINMLKDGFVLGRFAT